MLCNVLQQIVIALHCFISTKYNTQVHYNNVRLWCKCQWWKRSHRIMRVSQCTTVRYVQSDWQKTSGMNIINDTVDLCSNIAQTCENRCQKSVQHNSFLWMNTSLIGAISQGAPCLSVLRMLFNTQWCRRKSNNMHNRLLNVLVLRA
jgi:hypothetical protein